MRNRRILAVIAGLAVSLLHPLASLAESPYPTKPISMIVSLPVGTTSDLLARIASERLSDALGQRVVVMNQPGAGGIIGSSALVKAKPDGYTLGFVSPPYLIGPLLQVQPAYRPLADISPIIEVGTVPNVIVVAPNVQGASLKDLVAQVKAKSGEFNFASFGEGTVGHLGAVILNLATGMDAIHVAFKGLGPISGAMVQGQVHYFVPATTTAIGLVRGSGNRIRPVAVTSTKRSVAFPDVPTVREAGVPDAEFDSWYGIVAPAGTPAAIVAKLNGALAKILEEPATKEKLRTQDAHVPDDTSSRAFAALLESEYARFQKLIKASGIKPH